MKVISITRPGDAEVLTLRQKPIPVPGAHEVLIRIKAAGVNRPDVIQRQGNYPPPPGVPADIPGLEVAGLIEKCGSSVARWKEGDAVCALLGGGGYAEYVAVDGRHCLPVPDHFSFEEACSLPETIFTVWHNVFQRGGLKKGEYFLVHGGSSGIGITAIQLAKAFGAKVFTTVGSAEKCNACQSLGADMCINYKEVDFEEILKPHGIDVILDMIGADYIPKNIRLLKPDGRLLFINAMKGGRFQTDAIDIMKRRLTITGSTLRIRDPDFKASLAADIEARVWPVINNGKFKPVVYKIFKLKEAPLAHRLMESSRHIGKIVLKVDS